MEENIHVREEGKENSEVNLYHNNKKSNKEKLLFYNFLMNNTKIEVHIEDVQGYLYWVGILEYFTWFVILAIFISAPSTMAIIWIFFYHNARATVGLFILYNIPKTHSVIENLKDYENSTLEDIQVQMETNYILLIQEKEKILKPLLITYFILTIISLIVDIIMFFYIAALFGTKDSESKEFALLLAVIVYIGKYY